MRKAEKLKLLLYSNAAKLETFARMFFIGTLLAAVLAACSPLKYVPVEAKTEIHYIDSLILHRDTISVEIPREVVKEVVHADSSHLETFVATSDAWVDSLSILHHTLVNKAENSLKREIVYTDRIVYKDSLITKEVPVPVEVEKKFIPRWCYWSLIANVTLLLLAIVGVVLKFK